jgi:hypothetical protein
MVLRRSAHDAGPHGDEAPTRGWPRSAWPVSCFCVVFFGFEAAEHRDRVVIDPDVKRIAWAL